MSRRTKPLTERGNLRGHFNKQLGSYKPSVIQYRSSLNNLLLNKEVSEFTGRFVWKNLPVGLDSNIIETMLYTRGQLLFFTVGDKYYLLPFVYTGSINHVGVQTRGIPIPYSGSLESEDTKSNKSNGFAPEMEVMLYDRGLDKEDKPGIVLRDHPSVHLGFTVPAVVLLSEVRDKLSENLTLIRNNIILSQPMKYLNVQTQDAAKSMRAQMDNLINDILNGDIIQIITGAQMMLQDINTDMGSIDSQKLWQSYASLDALRLEYLGILTNGVFEKRERNLTDEVAGKQAVSKISLENSFNLRKSFCELVNKYYDLDISIEYVGANDPNAVTDKLPPDGRAGGEGFEVNEDDV